MANNLTSNVSQIVLKKFLPKMTSDMVSCKTVDRQIVGDGTLDPNTGDSIAVKRPHQYRSLSTADGDISGQNKNMLISGTAFARVQNYITVAVDYKQIEEAIQLNQLDEILEPARQRIVTDLEQRLNEFMLLNMSHNLGTVGNQLAQWSDVSQTSAFAKAFGFPTGPTYAQINPFAADKLADAQGNVPNLSSSKVDSAWEQAVITRNFGGATAYTSNALATKTLGNQVANAGITVSAPPIQTYVATKDTYTMVLALTGLTATSGTIVAGDQLAIGGGVNWVNQQTKNRIIGEGGTPIQYKCTVVTGGTADASGNLSVTVTGPAVFETEGQYNTVDAIISAGFSVDVLGSTSGQVVQPNMFYHKTAFGLSTVRLPKLHSIDSAVGSYDGFSIRVHKYSDGDANVQKMRFDLLPAFAAFNPLLAGTFYGK